MSPEAARTSLVKNFFWLLSGMAVATSLILTVGFVLFSANQTVSEPQILTPQASGPITAEDPQAQLSLALASTKLAADQEGQVTLNLQTNQVNVVSAKIVINMVDQPFAVLPTVQQPGQSQFLLTKQRVVQEEQGKHQIELEFNSISGQPITFSSAQSIATILFTPTQEGTLGMSIDQSASQILTADNINHLATTQIYSYQVEATQTIACTFEYSGWSGCVDGYQTRNLLATSPDNCVGTPQLAQTCQTDQLASCNQTCSNTDNCQSGLSCLNGQCRAASNPDDDQCRARSTGGTTTTTVTQQTVTRYVNACNLSCSSDADCPLSQLSCYQGQCRLTAEPENPTCQQTVTRVVEQVIQVPATPSGQKGSTASNSATQSGQFTATGSAGIASPTPTPDLGSNLGNGQTPDKFELDSTAQTGLDRVVAFLENFGINPVMAAAIAAAIIIFVILIVFISSLFNKKSAASPPPTSSNMASTPQADTTSTNLPPARPMPSQSPLSPQPLPTTPQSSFTQNVKPPVTTNLQPPTRPVAPQPPVTPPVATTPNTSTPPADQNQPSSKNSMVDLAKTRGIFQNKDGKTTIFPKDNSQQ